jgi:hypothetical protein
MKNGSASIELRPLRDDELELCLTLLSTALHKKKEMNALVRAIEEFVFRTILNRRLDEGDEFLSNELAEAFSENKARKNWRRGVREELWTIQGEWRGRADGPLWSRGQNDFDAWSLERTDIKLPSLLFRKRSISGGKVSRPYLAISISNATELFRVFLIRAVSNGQLSRFARCVVCGKWELKARAGRRSRAKLEFTKKHLDNSHWTRFWRLLPQWPGLCANKVCRDRFTNVVRGRSSFREIDFPGIQREGLTQYRPRGFRVGSALKPQA